MAGRVVSRHDVTLSFRGKHADGVVVSKASHFINLSLQPERQENLPFSVVVTSVLLSSECRGSFSGVKATKGAELTTHLHLVTKLRIRGSVSPLFHASSWRDTSTFCICRLKNSHSLF